MQTNPFNRRPKHKTPETTTQPQDKQIFLTPKMNFLHRFFSTASSSNKKKPFTKTNHQQFRFLLGYNHSKIFRLLVPSVVLTLYVIWIRSSQNTLHAVLSESTIPDRCWLKDAFDKGDFMVGSHRSLGDSKQKHQPSCLEGLQQLYAHKIHYLDLDMIYDPSTDQIVIAHPMEFQGTTDIYSPCAKTPLQELFPLLEQAMPQSAWFVSLEPKADWDRTQEFPLLQEPVLVLEKTLMVLETLQIQPSQCTLYIDANKLQDPEKLVMEKLARHCTFSYAIRRHEGFEAQKAVQLMSYDYVMPTIEFSPTHPNHKATTGVESLRVVQETVRKAVYWIVDTAEDLERVATFRGHGIVSNRPLFMVDMLKDSQHQWCPQQQQQPQRKSSLRQPQKAVSH